MIWVALTFFCFALMALGVFVLALALKRELAAALGDLVASPESCDLPLWLADAEEISFAGGGAVPPRSVAREPIDPCREREVFNLRLGLGFIDPLKSPPPPPLIPRWRCKRGGCDYCAPVPPRPIASAGDKKRSPELAKPRPIASAGGKD